MDPALLAAAAAALGVTNLRALVTGGQKVVATADGPSGEVIVKVIELAGPNAPIALERARREVGVLAAINHPNVVRLESGLAEIGIPPIGVCWLEERLDGIDLAAEVAPPRDWPSVSSLAADTLSGLTAFHERDVVHRDLSPRNIRHLANGSFKVMDPGIARLILETTITGAMDPGTPGYMSPEHVSPAARPTFASDVFAVGILVYEALGGVSPVPFHGDRNDYAQRLRDGQAPSIAAIRADLTSAQVEFVDTCLQRQLARRYLDAGDALDALART